MKRRYVAKSFGDGRQRRWGVYDLRTASWPVNRVPFGAVKQNIRTEEEAQTEADRLEKADGPTMG